MHLSFTDHDGWHDIHRLRNGRPPEDPSALFAWIHTQHISTPYEFQVDAAFDKVIRQHAGTNECWLAVSGPSHLGKSAAVTQVLLNRSRARELKWRERTGDGYLRTPYVYVEATSTQEARGLLASIARACGIPDTGSEKDLHQILSHLLVAIGTILIVVDDAQMYRRVSDSASRLVDGLRHLLHLPVPFVFVGIQMERSALLRDPGRNNDTVQQLQRRHFELRLTPLRRGQGQQAVDLVGRFARRMKAVPDLRVDCLLEPRLIRDLTLALEGRPGSILNTLKRATIEAIADNDSVLTEDHVRAEAATMHAEIAELRGRA